MKLDVNQVCLSGTLCERPVYSHETHGRNYYSLFIESPRLSGLTDKIRLLIPESLLPQSPNLGNPLRVEGGLRSYNNKSTQGSRLIVATLARTLSSGVQRPENNVTLTGTLCKQPVYRKTPLGREICDMILAVNRAFGRADYLPCIAWGANARLAGDFTVGDRIALEGRMQSRQYIKVINDREIAKTAFEISINKLQILTSEDKFESHISYDYGKDTIEQDL